MAGVGLPVLSNLPPEVILEHNICLLLIVAIFTKVSTNIENLLFDHKGDVFLIPVTFLLIILSLTALISFLGCFGSCLGNRCLVGLVMKSNRLRKNIKKDIPEYFVLLLMLLLSSFGLTVSVLVFDVETAGGERGERSQGRFSFHPVGTILNGTIPLYNDSADIQAFWDTIQHRQVYLLTDVNKASNLD